MSQPIVPPTDPAAYKHWTEELVRFGDLDPLGHVNNLAIMAYIESGRVNFMRHMGVGVWEGELLCVVASLTVTFAGEMHYPGRLRIGTAVARIGNRSLTMVNAIYLADKPDHPSPAQAFSPIVLLDANTRTTTPIPSSVRSALEAHLLPAV